MSEHTQPETTKIALPVSDLRSYAILFRQNKQYRKLWLSGVISQFGNWFNYIAVFVLLNQLTGSGQAVSWFLIAKFLPTSFFGPAAGVFADRFSRKTIMVGCDILRIFIVLAFLFIKKPEHVWMVYILALLQETLWSFADPARRASIPNICRPEELNLANALGGATWSVMLAVGAALGGFVTGWFGWETAIIVDAATFLVSALLLASLNLPTTKKKTTKKPTLIDYLGITDLREGCSYVKNHGRVGLLLLIKSGWALSGGVLVMLTIFGEQVFAAEGQSGRSGILYSCRGIGAAIGPIMAWRLLGESINAMSKGIGMSFFISSIAYLFFSQSPTLAWAAFFVFIAHMAGSVQWVFSTTLLQREVEDQFRGRVFATEMALLTLILSLSTWATGLALESGMDPRQVTIYLAVMFLVPGTLWTWVHRRSR